MGNVNISEEKLGSGSYASVFKGTMSHNGKRREVAVKKFSNDGEHDAASAQKEYDVLSRVKTHPNIIQLLHIKSDKSHIYLIMEYAALGDLDKYVEKNMPDLKHKIKIMLETATGICYMHSLQPPVIHRDIKPGNILMQSSPQGPIAKICDFGLAKIFNPEATSQYMSTDAGTPMYRAPEQFAKKQKYTSAVDVFSLGLVYMGLLNVSRDKPHIECIPESLYESDMLPYAQYLKIALQHKTPMPALFTLNSADKWPVTELKGVITQMAAFEAADRMKIGDVENTLQIMMSHYGSSTSSAGAQPGTPMTTLLTEVLQDKEEMKQKHEQEKERHEQEKERHEQEKERYEQEKERYEQEKQRHEQRIREMEEQLALVNLHNTPGPSTSNPSMRNTTFQKQYKAEPETRKSLETKMQQSSHSASAVSVNPSSTTQHPGSYRKTDTSFGNIKGFIPIEEHNFKINDFCFRFAYNSNNNMFFFPHPVDNCISCFTTTGEFVKSISLAKYKIDYPRSVHPLTCDTVLVAAKSGLYVVDTGEGEGECHCVHKGDCRDVHMCEGVVAVLVNEHSLGNKGKVYVYDTSDLSTVKSTINLTHKMNFEYRNTILISNDVIYICSTYYHNITQYSVASGQRITQYGRLGREAPGDLSGPRLLVCDTEGSLLVVDLGNHRLQTLTARGEWAVLPGLGEVEWPQDAMIIGDKMYVLDNDKCMCLVICMKLPI